MRQYFLPTLTVLLALTGVSLFLYPFAASWISQYHQSLITHSYSSTIETVEPEASEQLQLARAYNAALSSGARLQENERLPIGDGEIDATGTNGKPWKYSEILSANESGLMARLRIPSIGVDLPIYHGTSDETLLKGAGHLYGTSLPVGGPNTHTVITAHRGLANATMFTNLNKVNKGDTFAIDVFGETVVYRVFRIQVVQPEESEELRPIYGSDLATLVTCTPLGINSHRILVTGERVFPVPEDVKDTIDNGPSVPGFPWWALIWGTTVVISMAYFVFLFVVLIRRKRETRETEDDGG